MSEGFADEPYQDGRRQHKYSTADQKSKLPWKKWLGLALCCVIVIVLMILFSLLMQWLFNPDEDKDWTDDGVPAGNVSGSSGEASGAAPLLPKDAQFIEDVCTAEKLGGNDRSFCADACAPALNCCDPFGSANSTCFEDQMTGCFTYAKCHSLDGITDPANKDLDRICSPAGIEVNRDECERSCDAMKCCYSEENSCIADQLQACMDYAPCQNLREGSQKIDVAPTDLADRCGQQTPTCKRDCKEATCCNDVNSPCYRYNFIACLSYSSCTGNSDTKISFAPLYSKVKPSAVDLQEFCSTAGINKHGIASCQLACQDAKCCFATEKSCFGDDPLGCLEYEPCTVLNEPQYAGLTIPPGATLPPQKGATKPPTGNTTGAGSHGGAAVKATRSPSSSGNGTVAPVHATGKTTAAPTHANMTAPPANTTSTTNTNTNMTSTTAPTTNKTASGANKENKAVTVTQPPGNTGRNLVRAQYRKEDPNGVFFAGKNILRAKPFGVDSKRYMDHEN